MSVSTVLIQFIERVKLASTCKRFNNNEIEHLTAVRNVPLESSGMALIFWET